MSHWRDLLGGLFDDAEFSDPIGPADMYAVEAAFSVSLPEDLQALMAETNGITAHYGTAVLWPTAEIIQRNREMRETEDFRSLYMPFEPLLFVGEGGNGDLYGYRGLAGRIETLDVYKWDHEDDSRIWFARDLEDYLQRVAAPEAM